MKPGHLLVAVLPLAFNEDGQPQFGNADDIRFEGVPKKLAPDANSGEIRA